MRASYEKAVDWIALNDEDMETDQAVIASLISVAMVADLWGKDAERVAKDVLSRRRTLRNREEARRAAMLDAN